MGFNYHKYFDGPLGSLHNDGFDGFIFVLISFFIIAINVNGSIPLIDNPVFAYIGRHSMEIFVSHIVLFYVLVQNQKILVAGRKTFLIIAALTLIVSYILKRFVQDPCNKIIDKAFSKSNKRI